MAKRDKDIAILFIREEGTPREEVAEVCAKSVEFLSEGFLKKLLSLTRILEARVDFRFVQIADTARIKETSGSAPVS
jgi:hypothetical protein